MCHFAAFPSKIVLCFILLHGVQLQVLVFARFKDKNARYKIFAHVQLLKYLARVGLP